MNTLRNQVQLIGHVGADPDIFTFENGNKKASISVATNETYTNSEKEKVTQTQWHKVVFFGNQRVEAIEKFLQKGKEIAITGKLTYRDYQDAQGNKRQLTEIIADEWMLFGSKE